MTTEKPTCPFCLREMKAITFRGQSKLFFCRECEAGQYVSLLPDDANKFTAAVMEMRKRDFEAGLQRSAGPLNYSDWLNDNFNNYIDRLKAEAKEVK